MSRYVPLLRLGVGERADVYLGRLDGAEGFSTPVIMKRALGRDVSDEHARHALRWEATVSSACRHPHVVGAFELTEIPEGLVLVSEYINGVTVGALARHLRRERASIPPALAARIIADAALGLAHVHAASFDGGEAMNLVHGDISPNNLLLGEDGFVRVADFGNARPASYTTEQAASFTATPPYCSPEQIRGEAMQNSADTFALGMVLRALLIGGAPVAGENVDEQLSNVIDGAFVPLPPNAGPLLGQLAAEMTHGSAGYRPSMQDVGDRLEELSVGQGSRLQLRTFLQAEMGEALDKRRSRLRSLESGETKVDASGSTATFALLDSFLDGDLPELSGTRVDMRHNK